jgi:hypothetical protein
VAVRVLHRGHLGTAVQPDVPVRGVDAQNQPYAEQLYRKEITEWEAQSPATFSRACLAAFGGR